MDHSLFSSLLKGRRIESYLDAALRLPEPREDENGGGYVDDDRWSTIVVSVVRILVCLLTMMLTIIVWAVVMLVMLPWPYKRICQGNLYGHVTGRLMMWILGNPIKIEVGIAKKEIIWYPLFGQLYVLANHLRIDRSNSVACIESLKEGARAVVNNNLSLIIFPEGTRSRSGRLLPFKKGFIHLALQTRLPIVPMIFTGTHLAWRKGSLRVRPAPIHVKYLPPIETNGWKAENMNEYIEMIHSLYIEYLPESQKPLTSGCAEIH